MNIELRRYGIVIKSTPITGEKVSLGSGANCDVVIEDPYLAAHVGDLVKRGDQWFIVDAGTSLDGISRDGERVDDEELVGGRIYSIGGFELVVSLPAGAAPRAPAAAGAQAGPSIPGTIMESVAVPRGARAEPAIPGTIMESVAVPRGAGEVPKTLFEAAVPPPPRAPVMAASAPAAAAQRPSSTRRILILGAVFAMGLLLLLLLLVIKGGEKKKPEARPVPVATQTAPKTPVAPVKAPPTPEKLLGALKYDEALDAWELQLAKADDPQLRARYANLALEVGRVLAANQSPGARGYFERAVKFGPADSAAVAEAKRRIGS